jgi:hypothetical protein
MRARLTAAAFLAAAAWPGMVQAATPPAGNIEERSRQQIRPQTDRDREDALMTGDSDIVLLRRTQLFNLHASVDMSVTDNAYLSPFHRKSDGFVQAQVGIGFATKIADRVNVFADASVVTVRYFDERQLDYSAFAGLLGVSTNVGRINIAASWQPSVVFNRDFGHRQLTSHRFRLTASTAFKLRGLNLEPELHAERAITNPSAYRAWSGGGSFTLSRLVSSKAHILAYAQLGYDRRSFDNYFEAFVGTKRKDDNLNAAVGLLWRPNGWGEVRASYSFGRNWSTSDVNRYRAHSGAVGIAGTLRF